MTTTDNGNDIDVFGIEAGGRLSAQPVVNSEPGTIPFGVAFDPTATSSPPRPASTRWRPIPSTRTLISAVPSGQAATCWVASDGNLMFASNAGSNSESGYEASVSGQLTLASHSRRPPGNH